MREELKNNSNKPWNQLVSSSWFACAASPVSLSAQAVEKWHPRIEQLKLLLVLGNAQKQQVIYHVGGMRKTPLSNPQTNPQQGWKTFSGCDLYKLDANVTALIIFKCPFHKPQISRDAEPRDFPPKGSQGAQHGPVACFSEGDAHSQPTIKAFCTQEARASNLTHMSLRHMTACAYWRGRTGGERAAGQRILLVNLSRHSCEMRLL